MPEWNYSQWEKDLSHTVINSWDPSCKSISPLHHLSLFIWWSQAKVRHLYRHHILHFLGIHCVGSIHLSIFMLFLWLLFQSFTVSVCLCLSLPLWCSNRLVSHILPRREWWTGVLNHIPWITAAHTVLQKKCWSKINKWIIKLTHNN